MMSNILEILRSVTTLKREGKEWHGPCPLCGGRDRFIVWPDENRAWCRRCNEGGTAEWWQWKLHGTRRTFLTVSQSVPQATTTQCPDSGVVWIKPRASRRIQSPRDALPMEPDACEDFEERAAILEFDGGLTRKEAERMARALFSGS